MTDHPAALRPNDPPKQAQPFHRLASGIELAFAVLVVCLGASAWLYQFTGKMMGEHARQVFMRESTAIMSRIDQQMAITLDMLHGVAGLFAASQAVDRDEFAAYFHELGIATRMPGIVSIGFIERVPAADRAAFIERVRHDTSVMPEGYPAFDIYPAPRGDTSYVITYIEPYETNARALGFDLASDPVRLQAIRRAEQQQVATATGLIRLVQHDLQAEEQAFAVYLPVHLGGQVTSTEAVGLVGGAVSVGDLINAVLKATDRLELTVTLEDAEAVAGGDAEERASQLDREGSFVATHLLEVGGQAWPLVFRAPAEYGLTSIDRVLPLGVLVIGIVMSLLLFGVLASLATSRLRAVKLAGSMTDEIRRQHESLLVLERALATTVDGIVITDPNQPDNPIIYCNQGLERLTGYTREEMVGRNCRFFSEPEHDQPAVRTMREAIKQHQACRVVCRNYRKDRTPFWSEVTISPVFDAQGQLIHFVGLQHDMTLQHEFERKQEEQAKVLAHSNTELLQQQRVMRSLLEDLQSSKEHLEQKEQSLHAFNKRLQELGVLKDEFVAKVSHELRTPLTSIKEGISLLLDNALGPTTMDQRDFLKTMDTDLDRLAELINNMLDLSKIEAGRMRLLRVRIPAQELAESVVRSFQPLIGGRTVRVEQSALEAPVVFADRHRIVQVLTNLFSNALKFTPDDGRITLRVAAQNGEVGIAVEDSGPGISEQDLPKLFQKFSQVGARDPSKPRGTGLGLVVCKELAEMHGGRIEVASQPGRGTTFTLWLPAYSDDLALAESFQELQGVTHLEDDEGVALIAIQAQACLDPEQPRALDELAEKVRQHVHRGDIVLPIRGSWIVVLAVTDPLGVTVIAKRIRQMVQSGGRLRFGAARHPLDGTDAPGLLTRAIEQLDQGLTGLEAIQACQVETAKTGKGAG